jgi:hypothetical protein
LQHASALAVLLAATLVTALGFLNARRTAAVVPVEVPVAGLPPALHGFTVAQISDVHVGPTIRHGYLQRIVDAVNRLGADMVAVTGDLVDGSVAQLGAHVAPLAGLRSRHGTFFVTGNHEYYSGAHAWIEALRRLGLTVLMNEHVVLRHGEDGRQAAWWWPVWPTGARTISTRRIAAIRTPPSPVPRPTRACVCCWPTSRAARRRPARQALTCSCRATPMAASSGPGTCSCAFSSPSPPGCTGCRTVGLHQPWHRLLGPAQAAWCAVGDHAAEAGAGGLSRGDKAAAVIMIAR